MERKTNDALTLQRRNEEKLAAAKARLGEKWILHPVNRIARKTPCRPVLTRA